MRKSVALLGCCIVLTGCGGGSTGSGGASASAQPSTSTPTPTPSTAKLNTGEIKPTADATFIAATMELTTNASSNNDLTGQTKGGTTSNRFTTFDTPGFTGSYDATNGYSLADAANRATFGPGQLISDTTATDKLYPTVLFSRTTSSSEDYLALYKIAVTTTSVLGSGTVTPKYAGVAGWQHTVPDAAGSRTRLDYFAFGPATPVSAMPHTGIVKFSLDGFGNYAGDTDLYFTSHLDTLTVDFGAGTISGRITAGGSNFFTGGFGGLYAVTLAGSIAGNAVTGPTSSGVAAASGQFRLLFIGPNADEVVVTHVGQDGRVTFVGASVGVRNPYLT